MSASTERGLAIYWDFENVVLSQFDFIHGKGAWRDARLAAGRPDDDVESMLASATVDVSAVVDFAATLGVVTVHRAFGDWSSRWLNRYDRDMVRHSIDLVQLFPLAGTKNGADIRLALDVAGDLHLYPHVSDVVLVAGDSDYVALVQHARRVGRKVTGIGVRGSTSRQLVSACDEFKYIDTLSAKKKALSTTRPAAPAARRPVTISAATRLLIEKAMLQLMAQTADGWVLRVSIKPLLLRLDPAFDESDSGVRTFTDLLNALPDLLEHREGPTDREYRLKSAPVAETPDTAADNQGTPDSPTREETAVATEATRCALRRILSAADITATAMKVGNVAVALRQLIPGFSHVRLGFGNVTQLLTAQTDLVLLERDLSGQVTCQIAPGAAIAPAERTRTALLVCPGKAADILAAEDAGIDPLVAAYAGLLRSASLTLPVDRGLLWQMLRRLPTVLSDPAQVSTRSQLSTMLETVLCGPDPIDLPETPTLLELGEEQAKLMSALAGITVTSGLLHQMQEGVVEPDAAVQTAANSLAAIVCEGVSRTPSPRVEQEPLIIALAGASPPEDVRQALQRVLDTLSDSPAAAD
jgi:NYN domain/OST-HTH/LOTUS domain